MKSINLFDLFAKITLDSSEYEQGLEAASAKTSSFASKLKSGLATAAKIGGAAISVAAAGVAALTKASVENYAEYEQLVGGVETLFKTSSDTVRQYAASAYKTAGMSANEYMSTVTSFSARLLQGLGGNTAAAAEVANRAITDMSDNANKMGTSIKMIQDAYQGFAKQNYTMLDNLKLGFGGTAGEMARLINESGVLGDTIKVTAETVNSVSFDKIVEAIHVVQTEMGITGTTAAEASDTIQGSLSAAKAAWTNLVTGVADENQNLDTLVSNFVDSVATAGDNLLPRISKILGGIGQLVTKLAPVIATEIPKIVTQVLPGMISAGAQLLTGLTEGIITMLPALSEVVLETVQTFIGFLGEQLPTILTFLVEFVSMVVMTVVDMLPTLIPAIIEAAVQLVTVLAENLPTIITSLVNAIPGVIDTICAALITGIPALIQGAIQLVLGIVKALPEIVSSLVEALPAILEMFVTVIMDNLPILIEGIAMLILALVEALPELLEGMVEFVVTFVTTLANTIKEKWPEFKAAMAECWNRMLEGAKEVWEKIKTWATQTWEKVKGWFSGLWDSFAGFGRNMINAILDGLKQAWDSVVSWFNGAINSLLERAKSAISTVTGLLSGSGKSIDGSHAGGLDYVPYNGYIAELHRGEMVLTSDEAEEYRDARRGTVINVTQNIYSEAKTAADLMEEARYEQERAVMFGV